MTWQQEENVLIADLEPAAKLLMFALCHRADYKTGECWPSQTTLAKDCGLSRKRVNALMNSLIEKNLVAQVGWHNQTVLYKVFPTIEEAEHAAQRRAERKAKAHAAAKKAHETRARNAAEKSGTCNLRGTSTCNPSGTSTCNAGVTPTCNPSGTQTEQMNIEKNKEFNKGAVDSYIQTKAENPSVCVNHLSSGLVDDSSFDWDEISKAAVRQLVTEGFSAAEAEARVNAELEDAKWYVQQRSNEGWKNFNGEKIQHPQKHTIGTLANLARKTKNLPPITRDELTEVIDTNPQVAEWLFCGEEEDSFWAFLVCRDFKNGQGETISRWNVQNTIRWFSEFRENIDRRRYGFMRIGA